MDLNNNKEEFEALLTYLSKAFDCLSHELIIVKLSVYGFSLPVLRLIHDYIYQVKNKELKLIKLIVHGSRLHSEYLKDQKIGSILISDFFLIVVETKFDSYADDNTLHDARNIIEDVILL